MQTREPSWPRLGALGLAVLLGIGAAGSARASVYGPLANFDVVNDTGEDMCGFEIEIEGVHSGDIYRTFAAPQIRYPRPTLIDTPTGVIVHYEGEWDPATGTFLQRTPPAAPGYQPRQDSCWTGGLGPQYEASGCEHFGVSQRTQATSTRYRWLRCNPDGTTSPMADLGLPAPVWTRQPPPVVGAPEVVRAEIEIPNPEGQPYGEPYWVKIYKVEVEDPVLLHDLLMEDADVENAEVEIEWELMQSKPGEEFAFNEAPVAPEAGAVIRRYEFYRYDVAWGRTHLWDNNGTLEPYVDPESGEVVECVIDGCNDPTVDELGEYIGRQIAGFNLVPAACSNGVDDDGDELVDFPDDPDCLEAEDATEGPACGLGFELAFLLPGLARLRRRRRAAQRGEG